jgi:hypothetical protein
MNRKGNKTESFEGNFVVRDWWELFFEVPTYLYDSAARAYAADRVVVPHHPSEDEQASQGGPDNIICGGMGSDSTLDNAHVAEDYLARTTAMYRIIAVGRTAKKTISPGPLPCTESYSGRACSTN